MGDSNQNGDEVDWRKVIPVPVAEGNRVTPYVGAKNAFPAMADAIEATLFNAEGKGRYIYLLGWWLEDGLQLREGKQGTTIWDYFQTALKNDVEFRVILWKNFYKLRDLDSPTFNVWVLFTGAGNGDQIDKFNASAKGSAILDDFTLDNGQVHTKLLITSGPDGLVAFCGGMDIANSRVDPKAVPPLGAPLYDVQCKIEGPAANYLVDVFAQRWNDNPSKPGALRGEADRSPSANPPKPGTQAVGIARTYIRPDKRCFQERSIWVAFDKAIRSAERFIYLEDQFLTNRAACDLLRSKAQKFRGKGHITILVSHPELLPAVPINKFGMNYLRAARNRFIDVLTDYQWSKQWTQPGATPETVAAWAKSQTIRIFERLGDDLSTEGSGAYVHSKTWIFDDSLAIIGSANCDNRGWFYDHEISALICDNPPSPSPDQDTWSFAQKLRIDLWAEHLLLKEDEDKETMYDGNDSKDLWFRPSSRVRLYDPRRPPGVVDPDNYFGADPFDPDKAPEPVTMSRVPDSYDKQWDPLPDNDTFRRCQDPEKGK